MATDVSGGNWYRVWSIGREVIVTDDDKLMSCKLICRDEEAANNKALRVAFELKLSIKPLWAVLGIKPGDLSDTLLAYEYKRIAWYHIPQ
jgi:hypothetical protein